MDDRLAYIKANYTDQGLACLMGEDQILWLVGEVERLREHIADLEDTPASPAIWPR